MVFSSCHVTYVCVLSAPSHSKARASRVWGTLLGFPRSATCCPSQDFALASARFLNPPPCSRKAYPRGSMPYSLLQPFFRPAEEILHEEESPKTRNHVKVNVAGTRAPATVTANAADLAIPAKRGPKNTPVKPVCLLFILLLFSAKQTCKPRVVTFSFSIFKVLPHSFSNTIA